ncbi:chromate efflux transporter [Ancylobacter dichloromethanicus]|uniref:Chromate transporter n=1 Tax=Ancylobacter dichloromethanicus TaxID=518825 RepID=A0A9W6J601_9HYPH|nr:chromate efflux transporter [Ancylobacter dichloromethanicus]MBS7553047.1 chromate efflux transporter [Ancylobacter dichloromethanicus]GLK70368.1 chromate transporter [Ancylobacter dichloromethanicus]
MRDAPASPTATDEGTPLEVLLAFLRLGLTSFGGPVAHLGFFREDLVRRRQWLSEERYASLVALCQFLPGPASSQVGMAIGLMRAGPAGMAAAWIGFTLPSALLMLAFAYGVMHADAAGMAGGWLNGLKVAAAAIVADAVLGMAKNLCPDRPRRSLALVAAAVAALLPGAFGQIGVIAGGALAGLAFIRLGGAQFAEPAARHLPGRVASLAAFALFVLLLAGLPALVQVTGNAGLSLFDTLYRAGALVFGGGHVVLPLIEAELVRPGGLTREVFLAGYGAVQAVPGPLFSFATYVGAMMPMAPNGAAGGLLALVAAFLPSALLVYAALRFWTRLAANQRARDALAGVNAAVVGLLGAAFWDPVVTSSLTSGRAFALALLAYLALALWRVPAWAVVAGAALGGAVLLQS